MIAQPPRELWQDLKDITFQTNGIVQWAEAQDGKMLERSGRYILQPNPESRLNLPMLFVAPTNYSDARMSSICLLLLTEVEIDPDSRFNVAIHGRVLKAMTRDGRRLVFLRKDKTANHTSDGIRQPADGLSKPSR